MPISTENAEHYIWGDVNDGWHLLKRDDMIFIQERVPPGGAEVMHYHRTARQFFYILSGEATMVFADHQVALQPDHGLEIPPQVRHQFKNDSVDEVHFLVISVPSTRGDRVEV